jgi:hypothetical protein
MHREAGDISTSHLDLARVNTDPDLDAEHADHIDDVVRARDRGAGTGERRDDPSPAVFTSRPPKRWIL